MQKRATKNFIARRLIKSFAGLAFGACVIGAPLDTSRAGPASFSSNLSETAGTYLHLVQNRPTIDSRKALESAQNLMDALRVGRRIGQVSTFADYATHIDGIVNFAAASFANRYALRYGAEAGGVMSARLRQGLAWQAITAAVGRAVLRYAAAVTPDHISSFYMVLNGQRLYPGSAPTIMTVGQQSRLQIYVVPQTPGGTVLTPYGVAAEVLNVIAPMGLAPQLPPEQARRMIAEDAAAGIFHAMTEYQSHAVTVQNNDLALSLYHGMVAQVMSTWLSELSRSPSHQPLVQMPKVNLPAVEIGDVSVVKITYSAQSGGSCPRVLLRPIPIEMIVNNDHTYTVKAACQGQAVITGTFHDAFKGFLTNDGQATTHQNHILVRDIQQQSQKLPPSRLIEWGSLQRQPLLAQLPPPPPAPPAPNLPPPPAPPPLPAPPPKPPTPYKVCGVDIPFSDVECQPK